MRSGPTGLGLMALGLVAACATASPVVRLQPQGTDVVWVAGRAVLASARDGIRVAAAFDHQDGQAIAFRVEIANDTAERFDVDPKDMHFAACSAEPSCAGKRKVMDPEQKLLALDHARSQEEANAQNLLVASTSLVLLSVASDAAAMSRGSQHRPGDRALLASLSVDNSAARSERAVGNINTDRVVWAMSAFRRTTLLPGQGAAGLVYVPLKPGAKYVRLELNVRGQDFVFPFEQTVTTPPRDRSSGTWAPMKG